MNQLANVGNIYQGIYRRVLFVCSAGLLRSATAAHLFSAPPYNWNTRTAGVSPEYALNVITHALLHWADDVIFMEPEHLTRAEQYLGLDLIEEYRSKFTVLNVPDRYPYRDETLVAILQQQVADALPLEEGSVS